MAVPEFSAWNDFAHVVTLYAVNAGTGAVAALTGASCTAFMAPDKDTDAAMAVDAPEGTVTETATPGDYTVKIEGSEFDPDVCDVMFEAGITPYLHIRNSNNVRIAVKCKYVRDRVVVAS